MQACPIVILYVPLGNRQCLNGVRHTRSPFDYLILNQIHDSDLAMGRAHDLKNLIKIKPPEVDQPLVTAGVVEAEGLLGILHIGLCGGHQPTSKSAGCGQEQ